MGALLQDLRFGVRMLLRNPGVTGIAVLALALGIGVNSAVFSVVYAVLLRPLPVHEADRLVIMGATSRKLNATTGQSGFSTYALWHEHGRSFASIAAAANDTASLAATDAGETVKLWRVTEGFLPVLGVRPVVGRNFLPEEDRPGGRKVVLLSNNVWRSRFNADPRVLGGTVNLDGEGHTVVGVLPAGFHVDGRPADVYTPLARSLGNREWLEVSIYARLKPGVTVEQAQRELDAWASTHPRGPLGFTSQVWRLRDFQVRDVRLSLWVLLGSVALVVLIACANVATLLLARARARQTEIGIRRALGAGSGRIVRQVLTESALLALAAGGAGVLVAAVCVRLVPLLRHERLPGLVEQVRVDGTVLAFTAALSLLTAFVFGAAPAMAARHVNVFESLREGGRSGATAAHRRGWNTLVVVETALALVLAIGATLLIRTFFYLRDVAPGFRVDSLLTARVTAPPNKFTSAPQCIAYWRRVIEHVRTIPGVRGATFAQALPLTGDHQVMSLQVEGHRFTRPEDFPPMYRRNIETEYFRTMQIPLLRGRVFTEKDRDGAPEVVVVNETFARRFWPGENAVGKHIGGGEDHVYEVVGVVGDVRVEDSTKAAPLEVYFHYLQRPSTAVALAIRPNTDMYRDPMMLEPAVVRAVADADPNQGVTKFAEMQQIISDRIAPKRLTAQLIAIFAALALTLAAVGIYGLLTFSVTQRTHEIGVRIALGARRADVLRNVVGEAALFGGAGVAIGAAVALALTRTVKALLYGVTATDPVVYVCAGAVLFAVAIAAAIAPAWNAARVDPVIALRQE